MSATATTTGSRTIFSAVGNGIAVHGGENNNWFDADDNAILNFAVSIEDASNVHISSEFNIDLTGVAVRWTDTATMTFAGQIFTKSGAIGVVEQDFSTLTGETQETSFTASTSTNVVLQVQ